MREQEDVALVVPDRGQEDEILLLCEHFAKLVEDGRLGRDGRHEEAVVELVDPHRLEDAKVELNRRAGRLGLEDAEV